MSKVNITKTEWYPVFDFDDQYGRTVDIEEDKLKRIREAFQKFYDAQEELRVLYEEASNNKQEEEIQTILKQMPILNQKTH